MNLHPSHKGFDELALGSRSYQNLRVIYCLMYAGGGMTASRAALHGREEHACS
jgi:hypothetical protein